MKNFKPLLLIIAMLFNTATTFAQNGYTGPLFWELNGNTLTISGNGAMPDYSSSTNYAPWDPYRNSIYTVVMQTGITHIGNNAFYGATGNYYTNLTSATIPGSVISIGHQAFYRCNSLISVTIPENVTSIGSNAFTGCWSLQTVNFNAINCKIMNSVFLSCYSFTTLNIGSGVTTIPDGAFSDCNLSSLTIPNNVITIGDGAFSGCSFTSVTIGNGVTNIGVGAFGSCSSLTSIDVNSSNTAFASESGVLFNKEKTILIQYPIGKTNASYVIPHSVTIIGYCAFQWCSHVTSVTIPNSVITIDDGAFELCSNLTSVTIPNNVTTVGYAFGGCSSLQTVNFNAINCTAWGLNEGSYFSVFGDYPTFTTLNIGSEVEIIPAYAFYYFNQLTSITTYAQNPPTLKNNVFTGIPVNIPINIPCFSLDNYKNATGWKNFTNFVINGTTTEGFYTAKGYFPYSDNNFTNLTQAGKYYKTLVNSTGCDSVVCLTLIENPVPQLCMITVDNSYHNEIIWKKQEDVISYSIYREGAQSGQYDLVATIEPNSPNKWVDMESNAKIRSYRYKISGMDTCGKESALSEFHRTMHLTINAGQGNSWNLIWTAYEGTEYATYNIYRAWGDTLGELSLIGTMPSGNTSFSDFYAPPGYVYYMVEIMLNESCDAGKALASIKSNIASNNPNVGIEENTTHYVTIYPNPTNGELKIGNGETKINSVEIFDVYGKNILSHAANYVTQSTIDISHLPAGVYFLKIYHDSGISTTKVIKN